jgi:hypothetical protein
MPKRKAVAPPYTCMPDISRYRAALKDCFGYREKNGAQIPYLQIAKDHCVRYKTLMKYDRLLLTKNLTPKDFNESLLPSNGRPTYLSQESQHVLTTTYKVMDLNATPLFAEEVVEVMRKLRANQEDLQHFEVKPPSKPTVNTILKANKIPIRRARETKGGDIRTKKSKPNYLLEFYHLLRGLMNKYNYTPSEM